MTYRQSASSQAAHSPAAYHCFRCQTPLTAGLTACARCGQRFDAPVPATLLPAAVSNKPQTGRKALLWIAGALGGVLVLIAAAAVVGYRSFHNALNGNGGNLPGQAAGAGRQGTWTPGPRLTAQLSPPYQVAGPLGFYTIQPPAGFTLRGTNMRAADGKSLVYTWTGPQTPDGTAPVFTVMLGSDNGEMTSHLTSAQNVQLGLLGMQRQHSAFAGSTIQSGSVNGLAFSRGYWKGIGPRTGRRFHGLFYSQIAAPNVIIISGKDSEPSSRSSLPLFDAAALTLRKQ